VIRTCKKCCESKDITEFLKDKNCKDGYRYKCKKCRKSLYIKKGPCLYNPGWFKIGHPKIYNGSDKLIGRHTSPNTEFKKGFIPWNYIDGNSSELHKKYTNNKKYRKIRSSILEKHNFKCKKCGSENNIHLHHEITLRDNPDLALDTDNLIPLCSTCHSNLHNKLIKKCIGGSNGYNKFHRNKLSN